MPDNHRNRNPRGQQPQGPGTPGWVREAAEFESSEPIMPIERESETRPQQSFNIEDLANDPEIQAMNETYGEYRRKFVGQGVSKGEDILTDSRMYPIKRIEEYVNWCIENGRDSREALAHAKKVLIAQGEDIAGNWRNTPEEPR